MDIEQLKKYMTELGVITLDPDQNAQILIHGAGQTGVDNLAQIQTEGLYLKKQHLQINQKNTNQNRGLLTANYLCNDRFDNRVDFNVIDNYHYGTGVDQNGYGYNIISAIPQKLGQYYLGRILPDRFCQNFGEHKGYNCLLDDLAAGKIPSEFIIAIGRVDHYRGTQDYVTNPRYYALSPENQRKAETFVADLVQNYHGKPLFVDLVRQKIDCLIPSACSNLRLDPHYHHDHIDKAINDLLNNQTTNMEPTR